MPETSTVRVVINAVTEAAEQSIEDVGDEISGLSGDAAIGQTAMDQLSDEFGEATAQSMVLQSAMDELDDEIGDVGHSSLYAQTAMDQLNDEMTETTTRAGAAAGALSSLAGSMNLSAAASSALSIAFYVSLIPAATALLAMLAPLVGVVVALAAGAAALAGAFGLVVGSGILAFGQQKAEQNQKELAQTKRLIAQYESLKKQTGALSKSDKKRLAQLRKKRDRLKDSTGAMGALKREMVKLKDELVPLIAAFGEQFIPLIRGAFEAIPTLAENMMDAVGGTEDFKEAIGDFGAAMMEVLPALVGFMWKLANDALPYAREFFSFLANNGADAMNDIFAHLQEIEPELRNFLDALIDLWPTLLDFGTAVTETVLPALKWLIRRTEDLMGWINSLDDDTQQLVITMMVLGPVILKLVKWLTLLKGTILGRGVMKAVQGLGGALAGGGGAVTATLYGSAILAGVGLGVLATRALYTAGALKKAREAGKKTRKVLGEDFADDFLAGTNALSMGKFELFTKFGGAVRGAAIPGKTIGGQVEKVDRVFESAAPKNRDNQQSTSSTGGQDGQTTSVQAPNVDYGDINVEVNGMDGLERNPYAWSRKAAEQLDREQRQKYGAGQ